MKMELWVRSQDKRTLQKVDNIFLDANYKNKRISTYDGGGNVELGTYKTKERALEVLDEIQSLLQPIIKYKPIVQEEPNTLYPYKNFVKVDDNVEIKEFSTFVYQMPED